MAAKSGEFVVVPVAAHLQDSASEPEPEPVAEDRAAGAGVLARDRRATFADRGARARLTVADTNGTGVFARERGVSSREAVLTKNHAAGMGMSIGFGEALLGQNLPAGLREIDAPLLDKKFFADDYYFARKTAEPPFAGLVAGDEHGVRTDKARVTMITAGEGIRAAPPAPHAEQFAIDVLAVGANEVPAAADAAAGADSRGRGGNLSTVVGIFAVSSAVTMVAAGAQNPPVAFGTFLLLLGGLFVAVSGVLEN